MNNEKANHKNKEMKTKVQNTKTKGEEQATPKPFHTQRAV